MNTKYGDAAINAYKRAKESGNPQQAWKEATCEVFGKGTYSQKKPCPKGVFLGLCELGKVKDIEPGEYTTEKNKKYASSILKLISPNGLQCTKIELWKKVLEDLEYEEVEEEGRIGVVLALFNDDKLR